MLEVENLHCLLLFETILLMEQSSASENTKKEIEIELYQNEELMDDIHVIETSIEHLSLEIEASKAFENNDEIFI